MKKESLYVVICLFLVVVSGCLIAATISYCRKNGPVAKIDYEGAIIYEAPVSSPYKAARIYHRLDTEWERAREDEDRINERISRFRDDD